MKIVRLIIEKRGETALSARAMVDTHPDLEDDELTPLSPNELLALMVDEDIEVVLVFGDNGFEARDAVTLMDVLGKRGGA
jgi:hypothetical protein